MTDVMTNPDPELARGSGSMTEWPWVVLVRVRLAPTTTADLAKFGRFEDAESEAKSILRQARSVSGRLL